MEIVFKVLNYVKSFLRCKIYFMDIDSIVVKSESPSDYQNIYLIHKDAFNQDNESKLIAYEKQPLLIKGCLL